MGNRVYLYCTDFADYPRSGEHDRFYSASSAECEARASIPLFWMCLFSHDDIRVQRSGGRPFPYLFADKQKAIAAARRRWDLLAAILDPNVTRALRGWLQKVQLAPEANLIVFTEELDAMTSTGELEAQLRAAFSRLDALPPDEELTDDFGFADLIRVERGRKLSECTAEELGDYWPSDSEVPDASRDVSRAPPALRHGFYLPPPATVTREALTLLGLIAMVVGGLLRNERNHLAGNLVIAFLGLAIPWTMFQLQRAIKLRNQKNCLAPTSDASDADRGAS